jgi:hypothetical protein
VLPQLAMSTGYLIFDLLQVTFIAFYCFLLLFNTESYFSACSTSHGKLNTTGNEGSGHFKEIHFCPFCGQTFFL